MAESFIRVNQPGTGSKLKTIQTVDGNGDTVEAQAFVATDAAGAVIAPATQATLAAVLAELLLAQRVATATLSNVAANAASVTLLAANVNRRGVVIVNDSATATLFIKYGAAASAASFTFYLGAGQTWEMPLPLYTGILDGIWTAAIGAARITELTP